VFASEEGGVVVVVVVVVSNLPSARVCEQGGWVVVIVNPPSARVCEQGRWGGGDCKPTLGSRLRARRVGLAASVCGVQEETPTPGSRLQSRRVGYSRRLMVS
jgi:hypothetical protein